MYKTPPGGVYCQLKVYSLYSFTVPQAHTNHVNLLNWDNYGNRRNRTCLQSYPFQFRSIVDKKKAAEAVNSSQHNFVLCVQKLWWTQCPYLSHLPLLTIFRYGLSESELFAGDTFKDSHAREICLVLHLLLQACHYCPFIWLDSLYFFGGSTYLKHS